MISVSSSAWAAYRIRHLQAQQGPEPWEELHFLPLQPPLLQDWPERFQSRHFFRIVGVTTFLNNLPLMGILDRTLKHVAEEAVRMILVLFPTLL